tara:strand:+ start:34 stop:384 length:351 start_codon:yes stop_codon:yes gene_type:complete
MSNELSTTMASADLAAAMGFSADADMSMVSSGPKLARLSQLVMAPIMKEVVDEEGDLEEKVVVPQGSYKLVDADGIQSIVKVLHCVCLHSVSSGHSMTLTATSCTRQLWLPCLRGI